MFLRSFFFDVLFLMLFMIIAIVYLVLNSTGSEMTARRIFSYSYIVLGLLGLTLNAIMLPFISYFFIFYVYMTVPVFMIIYAVMIYLGFRVLRHSQKKIYINY
ncbi:hypothetical protein DMB44_08895 [Thermoplasma sp. Kam2015]|nr:hypothetical protein DMB44_08895 [Thermoplasma sp. Kam2015]